MVIVWRCARPWVMPIMFSLRVSAQRAGRPSRRATQQTTACSGSAPNLAPNAPPTSGVMTRISAWSIPSMPARAARVPCAPWFGIHAVSRPSGAPGRGRGPGLHRRRRDPLIDDGAGDDHLAAVEQIGSQGGRVAEGGGHVGARGGEQHGRVGRAGLGHIDDGRQHVIVDIHQVRGVLALVAALGDDHRHRLADVPDHVLGQQSLTHVLVEHAGYRRRHRREVRQVGPGERGDDAGCLERGADVDREDPRVRDG